MADHVAVLRRMRDNAAGTVLDHPKGLAALDHAIAAVAERDALVARLGEAATGECVEVGDDENGQPRVLIHSTRDELRRGPPLAFKRVRIVVADDLARVVAGNGGGDE